MSEIKFDQAAASALIKASDDAKKTLEDQQQSRGTSAQNAAEKFSGPYADLFARARETETADRGKIVKALQALSKGVHDVAAKAKEEQQRLDDYSAWLKRQRDKKAEDFTLEDRANDPEPERMPYYPPSFDAKFSATTRERKISLDVASKEVSADPEALKAFVTQRTGSDLALEKKFQTLKGAISDYADKCAWSGAADIQVFPGIDTYIEENAKDRKWISGIAEAFRKAGSGTTSAIAICVSLGESDPEHINNLFNYPDMDPGRIYILAKEIANMPGSEDALADLAQQWLEKAQKTQSAEDIARAAALITGISDNPGASAKTLLKIRGSGIAKGVELAGTIYDKLPGDTDFSNPLSLAESLRKLLITGDRELSEKNPEASREIARDILRTNLSNNLNRDYIISYLLNNANLSTPFLTTLGSGLEKREKTSGGIDEPESSRGASPTLRNVTYPDGSYINPDAMSSYMSALGNNPEASLRFFTGKGAGHPDEQLTSDEATNRQKYWIEEHNWNHDSYTGLSAALRSATSSPENAGSKEALKLASNTIYFLGNRAGQNKLTKDSLSSEASVDLGTIIATHMASVDLAVTKEGGSEASQINDLTGAGKKRKDLIEILGEDSVPRFAITNLDIVTEAIIAHPEGLKTLREGLNTYQDIRISALTEKHKNNPDFKNLLTQASVADAELEGWFNKQIRDTTMDNAVEQNERLEAWAGGTSTAVQSLVSIAPLPGAPITSMIAGQMAGGIAHNTVINNAEDPYIDLEELSKKQREEKYNTRDSRIHRTLAILDKYGVISEDEIRKEASTSENNTVDVEKWLKLGKYPSLEMLTTESGWDELSLSIAGNHIDLDAFYEAYRKHS